MRLGVPASPFFWRRRTVTLPLPEEGDPKSAMVVVAHPDDAEFLCAGTVARWCAEGWEVTYVVATSGDKGTRDLGVDEQYLAALREKEQRQACAVLGVQDVVFLGYPDGFVPDSAELRGQLVHLLRSRRPTVLVTWDPWRGRLNHRDHRTVGQVAVDAVFPASRGHLYYPKDYYERGLAPQRVADLLLAGSERPDYHVDITDYLEKKVDALLCHASQMEGRSRQELAARWRRRRRVYESFRRIHLGSRPGGRGPRDEARQRGR